MKTAINLSIRDHGKAIPYGPADRGNSMNHGFKALKGNLDLIAEVPEARDDEVLRNAVLRVNSPNTAFFSVGCEKAFNKEVGQGGSEAFWAKGYLEFSFNYRDVVADACNYFILFFKFNNAVFTQKFDESVWFHWELDGANFVDIGCRGWTCCVWIQTGDCPTDGESKRVWHRALDFLTTFLERVECAALPTIY